MNRHHKIAEQVSKILYLTTTAALQPMLPLHLRRRMKHGKEHPLRWREKLGFPSALRPKGTLVWLHAVGLGEVLALRSIISELHANDPELQFLVTSSTLASAETFAQNLPPKTQHQFLPLDTPLYAKRFLDHWRPDLTLWSEQDVWPGLVFQTARRGVPQGLINARMNAAAAKRKRQVKTLFRAVYRCFALISAQDDKTVSGLVSLDVAHTIRIDGSLKSNAPPLAINLEHLLHFQKALAGKEVWLAASCHPQDEDIAIAAHHSLCLKKPDIVLILAPRYPKRSEEILRKLAGFSVRVRSRNELPDGLTEIYLADSYGELGLWYKLANIALIGGTFSAVEGHNPWEALQLNCAVMHGPRYANFEADFATLLQAQACLPVYSAVDIVDRITNETGSHAMANYLSIDQNQGSSLTALAKAVIGLIKR